MQEKNAVCKRDGAKNRLSDGTIDKKAECDTFKIANCDLKI